MLGRATETEVLSLPSGTMVEVPKLRLTFTEWTGDPIPDYGGKPIIDHHGEAVYAELAILRLLQDRGWEGRCIDTFKNRHLVDLAERDGERSLPDAQEELLNDIHRLNGGRGGCWDVYAWRGDEVLFAESKWSGNDAIRESQCRWLVAALQTGLPVDSFLFAEWTLTG